MYTVPLAPWCCMSMSSSGKSHSWVQYYLSRPQVDEHGLHQTLELQMWCVRSAHGNGNMMAGSVHTHWSLKEANYRCLLLLAGKEKCAEII